MKNLITIWLLIAISLMNTSNKIQAQKINEHGILDLHYLLRASNNPSEKSPVVILLHGYGSNENDLYSLASKIPLDWIVVSVRAPFLMGDNQFKWYNVQLVNDKISLNFSDEETSRRSLLKLIDDLALKYNINQNKVITAGFSQGANMSLGLALTAPQKIHAAACFSGRFMEEIKPLIQDVKALSSKPVFIAHGSKDNMLPIAYAKENKEILEGFGFKTQFSEDAVGHSISNKHINEFINWLLAL